jgi:hypothetical protein
MEIEFFGISTPDTEKKFFRAKALKKNMYKKI